MKKFNFCLLLLLPVFMAFFACEKSDTSDQVTHLIKRPDASYTVDEITVIADAFNLTLNADGTQHTNNPDINSGAGSIPIVRLWQKRFNCHRIGICEFFPDPIPSKDSILHYQAFLNEVAALDPAREVIIPLVLNSQQTNFVPVVLYLTDEPGSGTPAEALEFVVDEDMVCQINYSGFAYVKIPAGTYSYNPNLGANGGYSIPLVAYN